MYLWFSRYLFAGFGLLSVTTHPSTGGGIVALLSIAAAHIVAAVSHAHDLGLKFELQNASLPKPTEVTTSSSAANSIDACSSVRIEACASVLDSRLVLTHSKK
jgi:hypothetical protein